MNLLKRELAPLTDDTWAEIDEHAARMLRSLLTARRFADISGPHGAELASVSTGRMKIVDGKKLGVDRFGVREARPLVEVRVPFELNIWELDNVARGARDIDLEPLEKAAASLAGFEEGLLYTGVPEAGVPPFFDALEHEPVRCKSDPEQFLTGLAEAVSRLKASAVDGPYAVVLDPTMWTSISSYVHGRPLEEHLHYLLHGPILFSAHTMSPFVISMRGGDLELVLGQDAALGYQKRTDETVELFLTESLTFRVIDGSSAIRLQT